MRGRVGYRVGGGGGGLGGLGGGGFGGRDMRLIPLLHDEPAALLVVQLDSFTAAASAGRPEKNQVPCFVVGSSWQSGDGMTSLTIISALLGVWLGLTFRVFILVPAAILALATLAGSGTASEAGGLWMIIPDISVIAAMQAGYVGGSALFVAAAD